MEAALVGKGQALVGKGQAPVGKGQALGGDGWAQCVGSVPHIASPQVGGLRHVPLRSAPDLHCV